MSADSETRQGNRQRMFRRRTVDQHLKFNEQQLENLLQGSTVRVGETGSSKQPASKWSCDVCNVRSDNEEDFDLHMGGKRHMVTCLLHALSHNLRDKLTADKEGITVSSVFDEDTGTVSFDTEHNQETVVSLTVQNTSEEEAVFLCGYELLKPPRDFKIVNTHGLNKAPLPIMPGKGYNVTVKVKLPYIGHCTVPLAFLFIKASDTNQKIHIVRFLRARCVNQVMKELTPTSPYRKPVRVAVRNTSANIIDGLPLPDSPAPKKLENEVKLKQYFIPEYVRRLINAGLQDYKDITDQARNFRTFLQAEQLDKDSYNELMQSLLWVEECQMEVDIRQYDMERVSMAEWRENRRLLLLEVPGLAEKRPSVLKGDSLFVRILHNGVPEDIEYKGYVHIVRERDVCLGFNQKLMDKHVPGMKFNVRFTFSRFPLKLGHRSVQLSDENSLDRLLFPTWSSVCSRGTIVPLTTELKLYDRELERNTDQLQAVRHILAGSSRPAPYIIFGPPGTGKTVTVVEAIKQVVKHIPSAHVLACAPSNAAVDLLTERLMNHIPNFLYRINAQSRNFTTIPQSIRNVCNWSTDHDAFEYPSKTTLVKYKVILCTQVTAGRLVSANFPQGHFTHIFLDESGHAIEPETVIPIAGIMECALSKDGGQVVLAGDPKQLGPVLRSPIGIKYGLGVSLLERLMNRDVYKNNSSYDPRLVTKLLHNYRSHPDILHLPNTMFYDTELLASADKLARESMCQWEELPHKGFPLIFHGVIGKDEREERSPSFFNAAEAATVVDYIEKLVSCKRIKVKLKDIGIVTPYTRQAHKIRQAFKKRHWNEIVVGSTEEFQGQEKKILLISTVRSSPQFLDTDHKFNLGFLTNPKRFNVSITRAKALLIVVGNPFFLSKDEYWRQLLDYCVDNQAYVGTEFMNTDDSTEREWEEAFSTISTLGLERALNDTEAVDVRHNVYDRQHIPETEWRREV